MHWIRERRIPAWIGAVVHAIGQPLVHAGVPWALSLLASRHGWVGGRPGVWNLVGLLPVAAGFLCIIWCLRAHFVAAPGGWKLEATPHYPTPAYILMKGPYQYSRNPIYLAEGAIWLGWIIVYGSLSVLIVFSVAALIAGPVIVPREERGLEARFGEAYRQYKSTVPRWLGRSQR